jgi:hypothetical protein
MKRPLIAALVACLTPAMLVAQRGGGAGARGGPDPAQAPTPRTADGHPDLNGLWAGGGGGGIGGGFDSGVADELGAKGIQPTIIATRDDVVSNFERDNALVRRMGTNKPLYKPQYWATVRNLDQNSNDDDPGFNCMPAGVPRLGPPAQIMETPGLLVLLYPGQGGAIAVPSTYRVVPTDNRPHSKLDDLDGTWNGESIGHWDGDTMVIDSIGFNSSSWLDTGGYFHSENMHVVERLTRIGNTLKWESTVEDPDVLLKPWSPEARTVRLNPDPKAVLGESLPCSERDHLHYATKEHH